MGLGLRPRRLWQWLPPRASFGRDYIGRNGAVLNLATACLGHWSLESLDIGPEYEAEGERPRW